MIDYQTEQDALWESLNELFNEKTAIANELLEINAYGNDLPTTIEKLEQTSIRNALTKFEGNVTHSANALGLGRTNLIAKMRKYNIKSRTDPSSVVDDAVADHPSLLVDS
tara:strand:- start:1164 stop:1493 length:330 start_codon:yes stop_codon:yes gene_type:complete